METVVDNKATLLRLLTSRSDKIKSFGVSELGLFGSFVRDTNINNESDVDLLVEFHPDQKTFDNFMELSFYLEDLIGRKIELVTPTSLSKHIGQYILKEVENVVL